MQTERTIAPELEAERRELVAAPMGWNLWSLIAAVTISACGASNDPGPVSNPARDSSIAADRKFNEELQARNEAAKDSIEREQQGIAFASLRFGMKKKEVDAALDTLGDGGSSISIGDFKYYPQALYAPSGALYRMELCGNRENASMIDTKVKESAMNLILTITNKYGPPEPGSEDHSPDFFKYEPGQMQIMSRWNIETKVVLVGIVEAARGSQYSAEVWLWDAPM